MIKYAPLIVILGPTASGKSEVALALAGAVDGEIISGDSRQVYKDIDIGTAKPSPEERRLVPHHLVDIIDLIEDFNLSDFQHIALKAIMDVYSRGKRPVLAGGSGLYVRAITEGFDLPYTPPDKEYRRKLRDIAITEGTGYLYEKLKEVDLTSWEKINPNDLRRIVRALEVFHVTGSPMSSLQSKRLHIPFKSLKFGIKWDREILYSRIEERVDRMFEEGLISEVESLLKKGFSFDYPPLDALGYPEVAHYLLGKSTLEEAVRLIKRNTRHFAKRQLTWFRKDKEIYWIDPGKFLDTEKILEEIMSLLEEKKCF